MKCKGSHEIAQSNPFKGEQMLNSRTEIGWFHSRRVGMSSLTLHDDSIELPSNFNLQVSIV